MQGHNGQYYGYQYDPEIQAIKTGKRRADDIIPQYQNQNQQPIDFAGIASQNLAGGSANIQKRIDLKSLLHQPHENSTLFNPENQRFQKDFALYDKYNRDQELRKKEMIQEKHRIEALERESRRWEQVENQANLEKQKREYQAQILLAGKRNSNGLPYNPLTLEYDKSQAGQNLKARDDDAKVRAYVRSQNLDTRQNSGYNILTGDNRQGVELLVPKFMLPQYQQKLQQKEEFYSMKYRPEQQQ